MSILTETPLRPKWTDRQRISAADLTAEQLWHDAQLSRLRRLALGWGVVAGLEVRGMANTLTIRPGYGITAAGSEVYLPSELSVTDVFERLCTACGTVGNICSAPNPATGQNPPITGWLVLKPVLQESCPRPTVPEGCAHPASAMAFSRQGSALEVVFLCELPENLQRQDPDCASAEAYLDRRPVPMPEIGDDILPLAQVTTVSGRLGAVDMDRRKRLLPLSVLQDVVACCSCHEDEGETPTPPDPGTKPWDLPSEFTFGELIETIHDAFPTPEVVFDKSIEDIFASRRAVAAVSIDPTDVLAKSFAASLLVHNRTSLIAFEEGRFDDVYAGYLTDGNTSRAALMRAAVTLPSVDQTVQAIWEQEMTGYHEITRDHPTRGPADIIGRSMTEIREKFGEASTEALAALFWIAQRAEMIEAGGPPVRS